MRKERLARSEDSFFVEFQLFSGEVSRDLRQEQSSILFL